MFEHWILCVRGKGTLFLNVLLLYYLFTFFSSSEILPPGGTAHATPLVAMVLSPTLPLVTVPTKNPWRSHDSACCTAASALHFLQVLTATPAPETLGSVDSQNCSTSLACKTLKSSSMDFKGSVSLQVFP